MGRSASSWSNIAYCLAAAENADRKARKQSREAMRLAADYRLTAFSLAGSDPGLKRQIERALAHAQPRASSDPFTTALNMIWSLALARLKMLVWTGPAAFVVGFIVETIRILVTRRLSGN